MKINLLLHDVEFRLLERLRVRVDGRRVFGSPGFTYKSGEAFSPKQNASINKPFTLSRVPNKDLGYPDHGPGEPGMR